MGRRGPKPLPTVVKEQRGTLQRCRTNPDEPQLPSLSASAPKGLAGRGLAEWRRLMASEWGKLVPRDADLTMLEIYCKLVTDEDELTRQRRKLGLELAIAKGIAGRLDKVRQQLRQYAAELGLSPSSRSGVKAIDKPKGEDGKPKLADWQRGLRAVK